MRTISITGWAHEQMTKEIEEAKQNEKIPLPTLGSIVDDCIYKRYKKRIKEEEE